MSTRLTFEASLLVDGDNVVTLVATGGDADVTLVDTLKLTYARTFTAVGDRLQFTAEPGVPITVGGFATPSIHLFDVTDPTAVTEVVGRLSRGRTGYQVAFVPQGATTRTMIAVGGSGAWTPQAVTRNRPSSWADRANAADYVNFAPLSSRALQPLKRCANAGPRWPSGRGRRLRRVQPREDAVRDS